MLHVLKGLTRTPQVEENVGDDLAQHPNVLLREIFIFLWRPRNHPSWRVISSRHACFSRAAAQDRPCHPASFLTSRTPAHHRHHRRPRHCRRLQPRAFPSRRCPRRLRYPRLSHVRWPHPLASQPLLLRNHIPFHRRHRPGTKAHAAPAHAALPPTTPAPPRCRPSWPRGAASRSFFKKAKWVGSHVGGYS